MEAPQERSSCSAPLDDEAGVAATAPSDTPAVAQQADGSAAVGFPDLSKPRPGRQEQDSAVLKLKGLPYATTEAQIYEFFTGFNVERVSFVYEPDGRPSGLAFAEFGTREEALQAMSRNGEYIGERYVRLLHVPRQEMEEQVRMGTLAIPGQAAKLRQRMLRSGIGMGMPAPLHYARPPMPHMGHGGRGHVMGPMHGGFAGVPQHALMAPGMQHLQQLPPHHMLGHGMPAPHGMQLMQQQRQQQFGGAGDGRVRMAGGPADGSQQQQQQQQKQQQKQQQQQQQQQQQMQEQQQQEQAVQQQQPNMSPAGPSMQGVGMPAHMALMYQMGSLSLGGPQPPSNPGAPAAAGQPPIPGSYGRNGRGLQPPPVPFYGTDSKTVKIRGLPFRATPLDILTFFEGYGYVANSLQLGVDALGRPSGEAWLAFGSSDEALRAVRERNRAYMGQRYLELSLT